MAAAAAEVATTGAAAAEAAVTTTAVAAAEAVTMAAAGAEVATMAVAAAEVAVATTAAGVAAAEAVTTTMISPCRATACPGPAQARREPPSSGRITPLVQLAPALARSRTS